MKKSTLLSDVDAYRTLLDVYSSEEINQRINNDFFEHSSSVYERFFLDCNKDITILARGVKDEIFNIARVKEAAKEFILKDNSVLNLYLRARNKEDAEKSLNSDFVVFLHKTLSNAGLNGKRKMNITFFEGGDEWLNDMPSVTVGDDRMYRRRYCKDSRDIQTTGKAIVNFGDREAVAKIRKNIETKIQSLIKIDEVNI